MTTPKSEAVPIQPESLVSGAVSAIKQTLLLRKESDESIHSAESDNSTSEHSNDPPPSISPDPTDGVSGFGDIELTKAEAVTTYTKEPGTGQTVPVKDNEDLGTATRTKDEGGASETTTSMSTMVTSGSTSTSKQSRSKKKQKAQQRREEKMRRRREKEEQAVAKRQLELQDSMDKESIASTSTVSTENYDDDHTHDHAHDAVFITAVETPKDESIKTKEESPEKNNEEDGVDTVIESVSIVIPAQEKEDITSSSEPSPTSSQSSCSEDLPETSQGDELAEVDSLHEPVKLAEEIGGTTTQVQAPPSSPPLLPSVPVEEERPQTKQPQTKPKKPKDNEHSHLPEKMASKVVPTSKRSPNSSKQSRKYEDSLPATGKSRPSKLVIKEGGAHDDVGGERPVNPHALAASLLKEELKSDKKGETKKATIASTTPTSNSGVPTVKGSTRKGDHASNKRGLLLDAQAQPFYPPPPQYPYPHPIIAQQRKPLLSGHAHRMPSPPYDYHHGYYPEEMHQGHAPEQYYERRRRKRSDPSKSMTPSMPYPPYAMEGGASYDRPHPYVYDPKCAGYVDTPEYLHHREYVGHHYPAHSSLRSAPPYDSAHQLYAGVHGHGYQEGGSGIDWEKLATRSPEEDAAMRRWLALRQMARLEIELEREREKSLTLRELQNDSSMLMALKEEDILSLRHLQQKDLQQRAGHTPLDLTQRLPPSSTLNRAPGEHPTRTTPTNLSSLLSGGASRWPPDCDVRYSHVHCLGCNICGDLVTTLLQP